MENIITEYGSKIIISVIIIFIIYLINLLINKIIKKIIKRHHQKNITTILVFVKRLKTVVLYGIGIGLVLSQFNALSSISIAILSTLGISSAIISLSIKDTLSNFLSSLELLLSKPFEIGDHIFLPEKNICGVVEEISIRHTIIRTESNKKEILPNKLLNQLIIENSDHKDSQIVLLTEFTINKNNNIDKVINIIKEEIKKVCKVELKGKNKDEEFPKVKVIEITPSDLKIRGWIWGNNINEANENLWAINYNLKNRFEKEKIK